MVLNVASVLKAAMPLMTRRNFGLSYILMSRVADPVQQIFLDKIREFGSKISDKNFSKEYPGLQKALDDELMRVTRQYGGEKPEDLLKFPELKNQKDILIDRQEGF